MPTGNETLGIIGDIYEASYRADHWPEVLRKVCVLTQSNSVALLYKDNELDVASGVHGWNFPPGFFDEYSQLGADPNFRLFVDHVPIGLASTAQKIIPDRTELDRYYGDAYNRFIEKHDMYHVAGVALFHDAERSLGMALQRSRAAGNWPDELIEPLNRLSPHFQRALHIHKEFTRLRLREQALRAGLDKLLMGLVLFDELLQPVYCNPIAESILDSNPALSMRNERLVAANKKDTERIGLALLRAVGRDNGPDTRHTAIGLRHPDCPTPLPMMITPADTAGLGLQPGECSAHAAVMFSDPERNQPIVPEALRTAYGLTIKEAQVAIAVANGLSLDEVSVMHGTKQSTVKSQLLSIYRKLGISRQAELVKLLLTGPFRVNF